MEKEAEKAGEYEKICDFFFYKSEKHKHAVDAGLMSVFSILNPQIIFEYSSWKNFQSHRESSGTRNWAINAGNSVSWKELGQDSGNLGFDPSSSLYWGTGANQLTARRPHPYNGELGVTEANRSAGQSCVRPLGALRVFGFRDSITRPHRKSQVHSHGIYTTV